MKTTVTREVTLCDHCQGETYGEGCPGCGKHFCYNCREIDGVAAHYVHAVHFSGSGDGTYCADCDKRLGDACDPRLMAYREIRKLRDEEKAWSEDFQARQKRAEAAVRSFPPTP